MDIQEPEFKFVRDVIRHVLSDYWPGIQWTPCGIFVHRNHDSPFSPAIQRKIDEILNMKGVMLHENYDEWVSREFISRWQHEEFCRQAIEAMVSPGPEEVKMHFLVVCASLSLIAALSVFYGLREAPDFSLKLILKHFEYLLNLGVITETFWIELEMFCAL
ncbi:hypothetical protein NPIL_274231 [Nephila pilipes]|uniref:Uncharacterized protein n=1 Tax=Nephila pilipes TaxID=299642 RepID=A0A8X6QYH6_NEPPI|nr:hypothetical protein NPIL_274231 [Nephila pilipes]